MLIRSVALAFVIGLMTTTGASVATAGAVPVPCLGIRSDGSVGAQCETAAQGPAEESSESTTIAGAAAGPTEPMVCSGGGIPNTHHPQLRFHVAGDEVNAFLLDSVVNRLLNRAFGGDR